MTSLKLYRRSKLGESLISSVEEMKKNNKISEQLGERILSVFDKV